MRVSDIRTILLSGFLTKDCVNQPKLVERVATYSVSKIKPTKDWISETFGF